MYKYWQIIFKKKMYAFLFGCFRCDYVKIKRFFSLYFESATESEECEFGNGYLIRFVWKIASKIQWTLVRTTTFNEIAAL